MISVWDLIDRRLVMCHNIRTVYGLTEYPSDLFSRRLSMKDGIVVRKAEQEDVRQIAEILVEDWQTAYRGIIDSDFLDSMSADQRYEIEVKRYQKYIVVADGREILGYAWLEMSGDEPADCEVVALYVRYSKRNNGIGKLLMHHAMTCFQEAGKKKMIVWCLKGNHESRKFYEKLGGKAFRPGTHPWGGKEYEMSSYLYDLASGPETERQVKELDEP